MHKFTVTVEYDGAKFQVHGSSSPFIPATREQPAEGGLEEITAVYLLGSDGKTVVLPSFLQEEVDDVFITKALMDAEINDAVEECKQAGIDDRADEAFRRQRGDY